MPTQDLSRVDLHRRRLLTASLAATGSLLLAGGYLAAHRIGEDASDLVLQLPWLPGSTQIGEIVAKRLGFYREAGLGLRIAPGGPSVDGVAVVASGSAAIGQVSSSPSIMLAVAQNIPVQCFATALQKHPFCFFSLGSNPVRTVASLVGKRVGIQPTARVLLKAALALAQLPQSAVTVVPVGADMTPLLTGQVDVITGWSTSTSALGVLGPDHVALSLWDAGVHLYALPYYTSVTVLRTQFDSVLRFLRATARGWAWARDHRDEAADHLVSEYPSLHRQQERAAIDAAIPLAFTPATATAGWGTMDTAVWAEQISLYARLGEFTNHTPAVADVMTLRALDATHAYRVTL